MLEAMLNLVDQRLLENRQMHIGVGRALAGNVTNPKPPEKPKQDKDKTKNKEGK